MTAVPSRPRPRSVWVDPRFLVGILVVLVSVAGVWFVVAGAQQTVPVLVAARTLVAGEPVVAGDVRVADVALGLLEERYAASDAVRGGAVAVRTVPAGELIPSDALGSVDAATTTTVVVPSATALPASVQAGARVELWAAPRTAEGEFDTPRILVADASVARLVEDDALVSGEGSSLELVVPRADVAEVLAALSAQARLSVVPTTGGSP